MREVIGEILLDQGYLVRAACDGYEAATIFPEFQPDLVILDMDMPLMNGSDVCAVIRQTSDVPIIMFTAADDVVNVNGAISKGTTDFVLKTTGIAELTERVAFHLANKKPSARTSVDETILKTSNPSPKSFVSTTLIVDPDERSRFGIKSILARLYQDFIEVDSAEKAIFAIEQHSPDIMITEWMLPDTDVFKMMSELKGGGDEKN